MTRSITKNTFAATNNAIVIPHDAVLLADGAIDIDAGVGKMLGAGVGANAGYVCVESNENDVMLGGNSVMVGNPGKVVIDSLFVVYGIPMYEQQLRSMHSCGVVSTLRHAASSPSPHICTTLHKYPAYKLYSSLISGNIEFSTSIVATAFAVR
jgi:hypothetical protein